MNEDHDRLKAGLALFAAIERGDTAALLARYAENAVQIKHPNQLKQKDIGGRRRWPKRSGGASRCFAKNATRCWRRPGRATAWHHRSNGLGALAVPVGTLKPGDQMVCESGVFMRFSGDRMVEQHNYDCFGEF